MSSRLSIGAQAVLAFARVEAEQLASGVYDAEHLVLGLLKLEVLAEAGPELRLTAGEAAALRDEAARVGSHFRSQGLDPARARRRLRHLWAEGHPVQQQFTGARSPRFRSVFERAAALAGASPIDAFHVLRAVLEAPSIAFDQLVAEMGTTRKALEPNEGGPGPDPPGAAAAGARPEGADARRVDAALPPGLARWGRDLTRLAGDGKLRPAIGRDEEVKQLARVLLHARKNGAVLVGEAGVGKTAIVEGLATRLAAGDGLPAALRGLRLVELPIATLVAGTAHRGAFEERMEQLLAEARAADPPVVLFFDEIHLLVGAGAGGGAMDAANILKPALARGDLRCLGATTPAEYRRHIEKDSAFERRFEVIWVEEPDRAAALEILRGLRAELEEHHGVTIADEAVVEAVDLSVRYMPDRRLPDKALDLLDQACARVLLATFSARAESKTGGREVDGAAIAEVVSERCRVPVAHLTEAEAQRLLRLEEHLSSRVLGQEDAVRAVAETLRTARAGLREARRPLAVLLFLGPTGVGKTELARALAEFLFGDERRLIRFDMSEYAQEHAVARLIGSPPGYVGHEEGGRLVQAVRDNPYSVVLLDEIDKAHPTVFDVFLQVFEEGQLTDGRGRRASFREAVVVLTANWGGEGAPKARPVVGFAGAGETGDETFSPEDFRRAALDRVAAMMRPELRNRVQREVVFLPLSPSVVGRIVDKILARVNRSLTDRGVRVELGPGAREVLVSHGYDRAQGARAMERAIGALLEEPLGRGLLDGRFRPGHTVVARPAANGLVLEARTAG